MKKKLAEECETLQQQAQNDEGQLAQFETELSQLVPQWEEATRHADQSQQSLSEAEQQQRVWQAQWDAFNQQSTQYTQQATLEQAKIQHTEQQLQTIQQQMERWQGELAQLDPQTLLSEAAVLTEQRTQLESQRAELQSTLQALLQQIQDKRTAVRLQTGVLEQTRSELQAMKSRHISLETLQQAALNQSDKTVSTWLEQEQLQASQRLAECLTVEDGWEQAVETVLGPYLEAVCVTGELNHWADKLATLERGSLILLSSQQQSMSGLVQDLRQAGDAEAGPPSASLRVDGVPQRQDPRSPNRTGEGVSTSSSSQIKRLLDKVQGADAVAALLATVYLAQDLTEALALCSQLAAHESVVTQAGVWVGPGWVRIHRATDTRGGILQRKRELAQLQTHIDQTTERLADTELALQAEQETLQTVEENYAKQQQQLQETSAQHAQLQAQLQVKQGRIDQLQQRSQQIQTELQTQTELATQLHITLEQARAHWQEALQQLEQQTQSREALLQKRDETQADVQKLREQTREQKELSHQLALRKQTCATQLDAIRQARERIEHQLVAIKDRSTHIQIELAELIEPMANLDQQLAEMLSQRLAVEQLFHEARTQTESLTHALLELDKKRHLTEQHVSQVRQQLEQQRLEWQGLQVRSTAMQEQIMEVGYEYAQLLAELPPHAKEDAWQQQLEQVVARIERLGSINLAAIDEYTVQVERKNYLDAQNSDLLEALTTLEDAIRKIDRETRARFKETYDNVNESFQRLFPQIFGGGQARLELTQEDLLNTGAIVMAQPPGKRNSTIHQLSGGEKALTAIALVFAIFQLKPAPFCILDEVDAPLDDVNVGRFCELVKEMSKQVQFIFVTHNKLAMEMAQHLIGVTMNESGVSRLVAVDIDAALALAEA